MRAAINARMIGFWSRAGTKFLPFADAASIDLPLPRLLRLSLFQVSAGIAFVMINFTLNRVMIVEIGTPASLVAAMVALPLLFAPARALIGHKSDHHKSVLGWKRFPYVLLGSMLQFGGLSIMPFALLLMTGRGVLAGAPLGIGAACLAFLLVGAGMATTQTAGLALATDLAPADKRPRVVALLYVMLLAGMFFSSLVLGHLLSGFTPTKLIQVVQGAAVLTLGINLVAFWKQEARQPSATALDRITPDFTAEWRDFFAPRRTRRLLVALGLGAAGFGMQDILLEPYGGQVLGLSVGATTALSALWSAGMLGGFAVAANALARDVDQHRLAGFGVLIGIGAFALIVMSAPFASVALLCIGAAGIGLGCGMFSVGTLIAAMNLSGSGNSGLALGAWGAVQATAAGIAIFASGGVRDGVGALAMNGRLGPGLVGHATGYSTVWLIEIVLLFATLVAIGPLVRRSIYRSPLEFGLNEHTA